MLFLSIGMIVLFTVAIFLFAFLEKVVPDMLIEKYFVFWTFVPTSGATVSSDMTHIIVTWVNQGATFRTNQLIFVGVRQYTGANPIIPSTTNKTIPANTVLTNPLVINGDSDLISSNIKKDVNIFGVVGNLSGVGQYVWGKYSALANVTYSLEETSIDSTIPVEIFKLWV